MSALGIRHLLLTGTAAIVSVGSAHAQSTTGTVAGTTISNTAQASYTVNGTAQTASSNTATFVVDRKVNLTVVNTDPAPVSVNLGQAGTVTTYRVTNNTNGIQDFQLFANQVVPAGILTGTDNFDLANLAIYVDANGNGTYDPGVDTATFIDELAPDVSATVFIVGDVPTTPGASRAQVGLDVAVAAGGATGTQGNLLVPTPLNIINQDNEVDVVFADNDDDGVLGYDIGRNGRAWAYGQYAITVTNVALTVTKSALVLSDPVNLLVNPKAIPGATVQYCLTVANGTLLTPASGINLTDVVPANTTFVPGSIQVGGIGAAGVCLLNGQPVNDDGSTTGPYTGNFNAATRTVTATIPLLLGGTSLAASFRVTVD